MLTGNIQEIYFAGGCFWGTEKLFRSIKGVEDVCSGYANGREDIVPDYKRVCRGDTGYRETVRVMYRKDRVSLEQLLKAYFYIIDPTTAKRQGNDIGDQYQTGIYYTDAESEITVKTYAEQEKVKYRSFEVEIGKLKNFYPAEEYHQRYLDKNPNGYCHVPRSKIADINEFIGTEEKKRSRP